MIHTAVLYGLGSYDTTLSYFMIYIIYIYLYMINIKNIIQPFVKRQTVSMQHDERKNSFEHLLGSSVI